MTRRALVTGGAGYIGSHVVRRLAENDHEIVVYDNLSTGRREAVPDAELVVGDLAEAERLRGVFADGRFDAVLHFAASVSVGESMARPLAYYTNNTGHTLTLLRCCEEFGVTDFVFSSSAAVYGDPPGGVADEETPPRPINPYGVSKLMSEWMMRDAAAAGDLRFVSLRYFNAAGAAPGGRLGQLGGISQHLIKVACEAALGKRPSVTIYGTDYPTPDGTCIRDYIHVEDLASAHLDALRYLEAEGPSQVLNCGYGKGHSVREIIARVKAVSGADFPVKEGPRRPGDPATLIANADRIRQVLGWRAGHDELDEIIESALEWERNCP